MIELALLPGTGLSVSRPPEAVVHGRGSASLVPPAEIQDVLKENGGVWNHNNNNILVLLFHLRTWYLWRINLLTHVVLRDVVPSSFCVVESSVWCRFEAQEILYTTVYLKIIRREKKIQEERVFCGVKEFRLSLCPTLTWQKVGGCSEVNSGGKEVSLVSFWSPGNSLHDSLSKNYKTRKENPGRTSFLRREGISLVALSHSHMTEGGRL